MKYAYILGIAGTFMAGIAKIAQELGYQVRGCDKGIYPPMSDQLQALEIEWDEGYAAEHLDKILKQPGTDLIVGNALSRGMPLVEALMQANCTFESAPAWLYDKVLQHRKVIAVSGTHGKTTTTTLIAWILDQMGFEPGFLIGGIPQEWGASARLGKDPFFVIEADEYDTAFFDKRPKFLHYWPTWALINNIEFDHADIYENIQMIQKQFSYLLRDVPPQGAVVYPGFQPTTASVVQAQSWCPSIAFGSAAQGVFEWSYVWAPERQGFELYHRQESFGFFEFSLWGEHNVQNAVAAIALLATAGLDPREMRSPIKNFKGVKRRLERKKDWQGIAVYEDFAHHPTAIKMTLNAVKATFPQDKLVVILDLASNTMRMGTHVDDLAPALEQADWLGAICEKPHQWDIAAWRVALPKPGAYYSDRDSLKAGLATWVHDNKELHGLKIVILSNGGLVNFLN